jgi:hypothetical protein
MEGRIAPSYPRVCKKYFKQLSCNRRWYNQVTLLSEPEKGGVRVDPTNSVKAWLTNYIYLPLKYFASLPLSKLSLAEMVVLPRSRALDSVCSIDPRVEVTCRSPIFLFVVDLRCYEILPLCSSQSCISLISVSRTRGFCCCSWFKDLWWQVTSFHKSKI